LDCTRCLCPHSGRHGLRLSRECAGGNADGTEANKYFARANRELRKSLPLTSKPYLSIFHMLSIAQWMGKRSDAEILLAVANKMYPSNAMSRCRFVKILLPRWGGSYAEVDAFVAHTRKEGVPATVIDGLVAIEEDDIGRGFESHGDHDAARENSCCSCGMILTILLFGGLFESKSSGESLNVKPMVYYRTTPHSGLWPFRRSSRVWA